MAVVEVNYIETERKLMEIKALHAYRLMTYINKVLKELPEEKKNTESFSLRIKLVERYIEKLDYAISMCCYEEVWDIINILSYRKMCRHIVRIARNNE